MGGPAKERLEGAARLLCAMMASPDAHVALRSMKAAVVSGDASAASEVLGHLARGGEQGPKPSANANANAQIMVFWARLSALIALLHRGQVDRARVNQRELYYRLKSCAIPGTDKPLFPSMSVLCDSIARLCALVDLPRHGLGILTSSKGLVHGRLVVTDGSEGGAPSASCLDGEGYGIRGDPEAIARFSFRCSASCVVVVEKETVFRRLVELKIADRAQAIVVTARGFPDRATRCFLRALADAFPTLPFHGLVDCNPDGIQILSQYKFGPKNPKQGDQDCAVSRLSWLGILPSEAYRAALYTEPNFTSRDDAVLRGLVAHLESRTEGLSPDWVTEARRMQECRHKVDVERFGCGGDLAAYVARRISRGEFVE